MDKEIYGVRMLSLDEATEYGAIMGRHKIEGKKLIDLEDEEACKNAIVSYIDDLKKLFEKRLEKIGVAITEIKLTFYGDTIGIDHPKAHEALKNNDLYTNCLFRGFGYIKRAQWALKKWQRTYQAAWLLLAAIVCWETIKREHFDLKTNNALHIRKARLAGNKERKQAIEPELQKTVKVFKEQRELCNSNAKAIRKTIKELYPSNSDDAKLFGRIMKRLQRAKVL
jgi:hypothetical protein